MGGKVKALAFWGGVHVFIFGLASGKSDPPALVARCL